MISRAEARWGVVLSRIASLAHAACRYTLLATALVLVASTAIAWATKEVAVHDVQLVLDARAAQDATGRCIDLASASFGQSERVLGYTNHVLGLAGGTRSANEAMAALLGAGR